MDIIRKSNSAWASPLYSVPKHGGDWRLCGDYCRLNDIITPDRYPNPHIQDFSAQLDGKTIFSKIWHGGLTIFLWLLRTLRKLPLSLHLGCTNICACLSDQRVLLRLSKDSWILFSRTFVVFLCT